MAASRTPASAQKRLRASYRRAYADICFLLATARKLVASQEVLLWITPSETCYCPEARRNPEIPPKEMTTCHAHKTLFLAGQNTGPSTVSIEGRNVQDARLRAIGPKKTSTTGGCWHNCSLLCLIQVVARRNLRLHYFTEPCLAVLLEFRRNTTRRHAGAPTHRPRRPRGLRGRPRQEQHHQQRHAVHQLHRHQKQRTST